MLTTGFSALDSVALVNVIYLIGKIQFSQSVCSGFEPGAVGWTL